MVIDHIHLYTQIPMKRTRQCCTRRAYANGSSLLLLFFSCFSLFFFYLNSNLFCKTTFHALSIKVFSPISSLSKMSTSHQLFFDIQRFGDSRGSVSDFSFIFFAVDIEFYNISPVFYLHSLMHSNAWPPLHDPPVPMF